MWSLKSPASSVPGCGDKKSASLAAKGILTIGDLLEYKKNDVAGVNIESMKAKAADLLPKKKTEPEVKEVDSGSVVTVKHNWHGKTIHTVSRHHVIRRVVAGPLMLTPYGAVIACGKTVCSPLMIAAINTMWFKQDIQSDEDNELVRPELLPIWSISEEDEWYEQLTDAQRDSVQLALRECTRVQLISALGFI